MRNLMMSLVAASSLWALPAAGQAPQGRMVVIGNGSASASPEFAQLNVDVTSLCYETARAAKDANAKLANRLLELLTTYVDTEEDQVTATGGRLVRQSEVVYNDQGNRRTICENKWRATNALTLKITNLEALPDMQDQLIEAIDDVGAVTPGSAARTYAELAAPSFHLTEATTRALRTQAQNEAYADAKAQFDNYRALCQFADVQLTAIAPPRVDIMPRFAESAAFASSGRTPIIPDDISVSASWQFGWSFRGAPGCAKIL